MNVWTMQLACPVRASAIMLRHLSRVALAWMMTFSLTVHKVQPFTGGSFQKLEKGGGHGKRGCASL